MVPIMSILIWDIKLFYFVKIKIVLFNFCHLIPSINLINFLSIKTCENFKIQKNSKMSIQRLLSVTIKPDIQAINPDGPRKKRRSSINTDKKRVYQSIN